MQHPEDFAVFGEAALILSVCAMVLVVIYTLLKGQRRQFEEARHLPLTDPECAGQDGETNGRTS